MANSPKFIRHSDMVNLRMAVEAKYNNSADIEAVWAHGTDPMSLKYFLVINTHDGSGTPYVPANAVYTTPNQNAQQVITSKPGGMTLTVDTAVAASYTAVTQLVTDNAAAAP